MKLYTPTEIAAFVVSHDLSRADERDVIEALRAWDKDAKCGGPQAVMPRNGAQQPSAPMATRGIDR